MSIADYVLTYQVQPDMARVHEYKAHLMDPWEIILFYQDLIETGILPQAWLPYAEHFIERGLCRIPEQQAPQ